MAIDFKSSYNANFSSILALTIADGTPYKATIDFLADQFNNYNISDEYKAQLQAQLMSQMTVGFTTAAMQTAISLTDKEVMADVQYENTVKQGVILTKQADKLDADKLLVDAQNQAIQQQVIDNRYIKATDTLASYFGTIGAGGLKVSAEMNTSLYNLLAELVKGDYQLSVPTSLTVTKVT